MSDNLLFETTTLAGIIAALPQPRIGFAGKYFTRIIESEAEEIRFDIEGEDIRLAPFVSPLVAGKIVEGQTYATRSFRPAYIKDKTIFTPQAAMKRRMGEAIGGELSAPERVQLALADELASKVQRLERRLEWMAVQALLDGKVSVSGEQYPAVLVDFGRSAHHTKVLAAGSQWGQSGVSPLKNLHQWSDEAQSPITDWYLTQDAWAQLREHEDTWKRMELVRGTSSVQPDAVLGRDLTFMGVLDGFRLWVVPRVNVQHEDGSSTRLVPDGTVLGVADAWYEGARCFGAIRDLGSLLPGAWHVKSWEEPDPSARFLLLQSAPLMVPLRPDCSMRVSVL